MRTASVRFRITALATLVVALVLSVAAVALVTVQRSSQMASVDSSLLLRLEEVAIELEQSVPPTIPNPLSDDRLAQFVSQEGSVEAASMSLALAPPIAPTVETGQVLRTTDGLPVDDDIFRILSRRVDSAAGPGTLHVAKSIDDLLDSVNILSLSLAVLVPLLGAALAAMVWWLVGRTLRPVDAIRREVASIGGEELHRRVPVPLSGDEIAELASTMNSMLERLEDSSGRERRFTADASHELRTPLTRIRTLLETSNELTASQVTTEVLEEISRLESLIRDLLYLARSGADGAEHRPVDLDDIVFREVEAVRVAGSVQVDTSGVSGGHVLGSSSQLASAVRNLIDNGSRHAASKLTVSLAELGDEVVLTVCDDGPGVPREARERIFDRFTQLDDARSTDGTGLGLAITKSIITDHGGTIAVDELAEGGACFVVRLPVDLA